MSGKEMLLKQFEYNFWANDRVFAQAELVPLEELMAPSVIEGRSLLQVLAHLVRTEKVWRLLARDGDVQPSLLPGDQQLATIEAVKDFGQQEYQKIFSLIKDLTQETLDEVVQIRRWDGVQVSMSRSDMLVHLALHSMQHRSEAAVLLTQYGHSPGNLDYLFFVLQ